MSNTSNTIPRKGSTSPNMMVGTTHFAGYYTYYSIHLIRKQQTPHLMAVRTRGYEGVTLFYIQGTILMNKTIRL